MIPTTSDPLGTGGIASYGEFQDFQTYDGSQWRDTKFINTALVWPARWHSNDINTGNWIVRILFNVENNVRFIDFTAFYQDGWLVQPQKPSFEGAFITAFIFHNGSPITQQYSITENQK